MAAATATMVPPISPSLTAQKIATSISVNPTDDNLSPAARPKLLAHLRALSLRHDEVGQEIALNLLLRNLTHHNLFEHAESLTANTVLKQPYRSTNQAARFFYYDGLIKAMRLDYTASHHSLMQALRKAPERAQGFRIAATKLFLVVQLLMGEIPPRSEFMQDGMKESLQPYLALTSCVRFGNLNKFASILKKHETQFEHDKTISLIVRLRQHVLKMGLRRLCQAYKRIAIKDVCVKLAVDNPEDAEYIVAKAIRDGVIEASIDHANGHIVTSDTVDVYSTTEPLQAFQRRVNFCNTVFDEARRAMRYSTETMDDDDAVKKAEAEKRDALARAQEDDGGSIDFFDGI